MHLPKTCYNLSNTGFLKWRGILGRGYPDRKHNRKTGGYDLWNITLRSIRISARITSRPRSTRRSPACSPGTGPVYPIGVYQIREPLRIRSDNRLKYCSIRLSGIYEVPSADLEAAVQVEGDYLTFEMDKLTSNDKSDYYNQTEDDILPGGYPLGKAATANTSLARSRARVRHPAAAAGAGYRPVLQ